MSDKHINRSKIIEYTGPDDMLIDLEGYEVVQVNNARVGITTYFTEKGEFYFEYE